VPCEAILPFAGAGGFGAFNALRLVRRIAMSCFVCFAGERIRRLVVLVSARFVWAIVVPFCVPVCELGHPGSAP
jgi:hypothetical protein